MSWFHVFLFLFSIFLCVQQFVQGIYSMWLNYVTLSFIRYLIHDAKYLQKSRLILFPTIFCMIKTVQIYQDKLFSVNSDFLITCIAILWSWLQVILHTTVLLIACQLREITYYFKVSQKLPSLVTAVLWSTNWRYLTIINFTFHIIQNFWQKAMNSKIKTDVNLRTIFTVYSWAYFSMAIICCFWCW